MHSRNAGKVAEGKDRGSMAFNLAQVGTTPSPNGVPKNGTTEEWLNQCRPVLAPRVRGTEHQEGKKLRGPSTLLRWTASPQ